MHSAPLPYTHRYLRIAVAILLVVHLVPFGEAQQVDLSTEDGHYAANLHWSGPDEAPPANATVRWVQLDAEPIAWSVDADGTFACIGTNGTATRSNGTALIGTCAARSDNRTLLFSFETDNDMTWNGTVTGPVEMAAALEATDAAPSLVPGAILTAFALVFFTTSAVFVLLYLQERRIARYLVRRLYEETKGRMPADWPENLRQQWIARIFIRGKN